MRAGHGRRRKAVDAGNATVVATTYKTVAVDGGTRTERPRWLLDLNHANAVLRPPASPTARPLPVTVTPLSDTLRTRAGGVVETATPGGPGRVRWAAAGSGRYGWGLAMTGGSR